MFSSLTISPMPSALQIYQTPTDLALLSVHDQTLFVTVRGDIQPILEKMDHLLPLVWGQPRTLRVHRVHMTVNDYAFEKFRPLYYLLRTPLQQHVQKYQLKKVVFAGHSMGGSIALLSAFYSFHRGYLPFPPKVYTFNSPKTGDSMFNTLLHMYHIPVYHVVEENDLVTHLPLSSKFEASPSLFSIHRGVLYNCSNTEQWVQSHLTCTSMAPSLQAILSNLTHHINIHFQFFQKKQYFTYFSFTQEEALKKVLSSL
ncbi:hypothetical protein HMI55_006604 [Coelomomyces lativittatus]|nr:hypothetical protein HMI55_006603 [Coelomomyces lativittatus]KAJ1511419.1 hypothetical protein HMI55_006604 [Coelomomyces lativittatus]